MDGAVDTVLTIVTLYPDLLGTYGDSGNALVLSHRARARGFEVRSLDVQAGNDVPRGDVYLLGGGEDGPQRLACELLRQSSLVERVHDGAHLLAVCAGLQLLGRQFSVEGDASYPGLGLVNAVTERGAQRSVGDMASRVGDDVLVGFENHGGVTTLGPDVLALGTMLVGRGNDGSVDGFRLPRVWATYAHGPVLALNPWLADDILSVVLGETLAPLESVADRLYRERCRVLGVA